MSGVLSTVLKAPALVIIDRIGEHIDGRPDDDLVAEARRRAHQMRRLIDGRAFKRRVFEHGAKA